ncbi:MAG: hypothetical protein HYY67_04420 [Thaumarchaeota archaeon]|nr:hypothetical protein [Nitrososphaerota archaeon]
MNKTVPIAVMVGLVVAIASFGYGYSSGTQVYEGVKVSGWVKVQVVREGKVIYFQEGHNLITNQGIDIIAKQLIAGTNASVKANPLGTTYIALTTTAITPAAGDTTLSGEITTNGLQRAEGVYNHANSTSTIIVKKTFTASGSFTAVQAAGLFNSNTASSAGMLAENTFSSVNLISGDQITITWTITIS